MSVKTKVKDIPVIIDPLSFLADLEIVSGNIAQTYNEETKEYEADRRVLPCVLMPAVSVFDADSASGKQPITSCEWFEGAPKNDNSNKIANGENYEISASGKPKWSLSVKKNVDVNIPIDIHAIFTIADPRKGTEVKIERSISLYTSLYDEKVYSLQITDKPSQWKIDPLRVKEDAQGHWYHTISAQLYCSSKEVADANAAYWWQIKDTNGWRNFTQDEKDIYISGDNTKTLRFDARFIRKATFRCIASHYTGTRPSTPTNGSLIKESSVKIEFPNTLRAEVRQIAGAKVNASLSTNVQFECVLTDNQGVVPSSKNKLFCITWFGVSGKPGTSHKKIGQGRIISFSPSSLGFDKNYSMAVYADVKMHAVRALVTKDNKVLTSAGKVVTATKFE